jgi:hypothetical protein
MGAINRISIEIRAFGRGLGGPPVQPAIRGEADARFP